MFVLKTCFLAALLLALAGMTGCTPQAREPNAPISPQPLTPSTVSTNVETYGTRGVVEEIFPGGLKARIRHEAIPNYMPAMTMDLEAKSTNELVGLKTGDVISFRLNVTDDDAWIDQVNKVGAQSPTELPSRRSVRIVKDVEPLEIGDRVPDYSFTNQFGQAVNLAAFRGKALAISFIFTTCPLPTFCPRMSLNLAKALEKLKGMPDAPQNWHLLSITIDPEVDKPAVLKHYAERYNYNPDRWSFLTGDLLEITAITEQFGQTFWREANIINHNLRTVIVDASGRLQNIIPGNEWNADELVEELIKAAKVSGDGPAAE